MSLKAKIEAVIYASEDPVTLAQLTGLLGQEAQRELDQLATSQQSLELGPGGAADEIASSRQESQPPEIDLEPVQAELEEESANSSQSSRGAIDSTAERAEQRLVRDRDRKLREYLLQQIQVLIAEYATPERGLDVREVAGGYRMATKPEYHDAVRGFVKSLKPPLRLTLQALETLAVVAYKQPVTSPEISEIRGVDSGGVLGSLLGRKLITTAGRKQVIGRPILYRTTKDFLLRFGLKDITELPSIEEFEKLAGEWAEQEEIPMPSERAVRTTGQEDLRSAEERITHEEMEEQKDVTEPQADGDGEDLQVDSSDRPEDARLTIDGRLSGRAPREGEAGEGPSTDEHPSAVRATIQSERKGA